MKKFIMIAGILIALVLMVVFVNKKRSSEEKLETKMVQNVAIQNFMMNPNPQTIDDLLPPELQTDPWGTKYSYKTKFGRYLIWSAGPDKNFSNLIFGDDDMLILERGTVNLNQKEDEIINMLMLERSAVLAEVLLNSKNKKLKDTAREWAKLNGYIIVGENDPRGWFKELKMK